ncbi:MAG: hypothetical protein HUJ97_10205, partial [Bacteroidales bacterium]|nr:hypothetical protein [Bacteroidales bacterium]
VNNVERAIEYYRKAQKVDPSRSNINYQLAVCYHRKQDYKQEMHYFEQYLKYAPEDEDPNTIEYAKECIEECRKVLFMKGN